MSGNPKYGDSTETSRKGSIAERSSIVGVLTLGDAHDKVLCNETEARSIEWNAS